MNKNYLNYINFQTNPTHKTSLKDITQQETSTSPYPQQNSQHPHTNIPNAFNPINPINRNAYLNPAAEPRQEPPKHSSRNSNSKDPFGSRQSQELITSKKQLTKSNSKTSSQGFNRVSCDSDSSSKPPLYATEKDKSNSTSNYSKTVDFGSLKYQQHQPQLDSSGHSTSDEADLKSRLNYLEVIEQSLKQYEGSRSPLDLKQMNEDNRLLMLGVFDEINKAKEDKNRQTISDCISQSDNYSEDGHSLDSRSNSFYQKTDKRRFMEGLTRSKEKIKAKEKEVELEIRLNEKLRGEVEEETRKLNQKDQSELEKLCISVQKQEEEVKRITAMNDEVSSKLTHLPFHHEWKLMCGEADGARKARVKIEEEITRRKERLSESTRKEAMMGQETSGNQREQEQGREGSASKSRLSSLAALKIPPSPANRPNGGQLASGSNRAIQQNSARQSNEARSKSANRFKNSS